MENAEIPGEVIKRELEARGWTQADLAFILGRQQPEISAIISGKRSISPEVAYELAVTLGKDAHYWLSLEAAYNASKVTPNDEKISRRLKLYESYPIREMMKRGWIEPTDDIDLLEQRVCEFLGIKSLDEQPEINYAARKSTKYPDLTPTQTAWIIRVRQLARYVPAIKFTDRLCNEGLEKLRLFQKDLEEVRHVPRTLSETGIRLVLVEALPSTGIDGVCTWLDRHSPVIGISQRLDRIDGFWHTLLHEMHHVKHHEGQDNPILDLNLVGEDAKYINDKPEMEKRADVFAAEFSIKKSDLNNFIARIRPLYSKQRVQAFAARMMVHPGIVVGQLQHRGEIPYSHQREMLVKVRHLLSDSALTDGWGYKPSIKQESKQRVA
jgi:HTH-type transcriptional regulator/antitoxin HigA